MADIPCLSDEELLPIGCREPASDAIVAHLSICSRCQQRLELLGAELDDLRNAACLLEERCESPFDVETVTGAVPPHTSVSHSPVVRPDAQPIPTTIGRYPIIRRLAIEGQSSVYIARHPTLDRDVVVKWSHRAAPPESLDRDRLVREAKLLAELGDPPHLVRVHDLEFHDDRPFLVMEYIRGRNLQQHAEQVRPTPIAAAQLTAKLARGLAGPHRLGVIHRDLKPKNVLIDEAGEPRLIDFGLALRRDAWIQESEAPGSVAGTAGYMAPEQARGEVERVDARSDVFALGGILYYLLTGKAPYTGRTFDEVLQRAREGAFDREALKAAGIPPRLASICLKAMAVNPADRYAQADDMARELERLSRPAGSRLLPILAVVLLVGVGLTAWALSRPGGLLPTTAAPSEPEPQYLLQVNGQPLGALTRPVPLRVGDRLKIRCDVPRGLQPALFWLDTEGGLEEPPGVEVISAEPFTHLTYPESAQVVKLKQPAASGSVLALVCAGREKPRLEDVHAMWREARHAAKLDSGRLPLLPRETVLVLGRDQVRPLSRDRGDWGRPEQDALATVEDCLVQWRPLLRQRYEFVAGVAVGYLR